MIIASPSFTRCRATIWVRYCSAWIQTIIDLQLPDWWKDKHWNTITLHDGSHLFTFPRREELLIAAERSVCVFSSCHLDNHVWNPLVLLLLAVVPISLWIEGIRVTQPRITHFASWPPALMSSFPSLRRHEARRKGIHSSSELEELKLGISTMIFRKWPLCWAITW